MFNLITGVPSVLYITSFPETSIVFTVPYTLRNIKTWKQVPETSKVHRWDDEVRRLVMCMSWGVLACRLHQNHHEAKSFKIDLLCHTWICHWVWVAFGSLWKQTYQLQVVQNFNSTLQLHFNDLRNKMVPPRFSIGPLSMAWSHMTAVDAQPILRYGRGRMWLVLFYFYDGPEALQSNN